MFKSNLPWGPQSRDPHGHPSSQQAPNMKTKRKERTKKAKREMEDIRKKTLLFQDGQICVQTYAGYRLQPDLTCSFYFKDS